MVEPLSSSATRSRHATDPAPTPRMADLAAPAIAVVPSSALARRAAGDHLSTPPEVVLQLQRTAGNRSLARLFGRTSSASIQRNGKSAEALTNLATPQILKGPKVELQKKIVEKLEKQPEIGEAFVPICNLGGIEITNIPKDDDKLIKHAKLVNLFKEGRKSNFVSAGSPRFEAVEKAGVAGDVVKNTLKTMIAAGQIDYLRKAGLPNKEWKILVEVHYYRDRSTEQTGLHKDTKGETLFVNLNYHIPQDVIGPEYVVNPLPSKEHDAQLKLPPQFLEDLAATRARLPKPTMIRTGVVKPYGVVAFVDEAVHHATPFYGSRIVLGGEFKAFLEAKYSKELKEAKRGYRKWSKSVSPEREEPFSTHLKTTAIAAKDSEKWLTWMRMIEDANEAKQYTRQDFEKSGMTSGEVDHMLAVVGKTASRLRGHAGGFQAASIEGTGLVPITPEEEPPRQLKRQLSDPDLTKGFPDPLPKDEKRRFFRTWVRAIPASVDLSSA
jgi:hypothetical protein